MLGQGKEGGNSKGKELQVTEDIIWDMDELLTYGSELEVDNEDFPKDMVKALNELANILLVEQLEVDLSQQKGSQVLSAPSDV